MRFIVFRARLNFSSRRRKRKSFAAVASCWLLPSPVVCNEAKSIFLLQVVHLNEQIIMINYILWMIETLARSLLTPIASPRLLSHSLAACRNWIKTQKYFIRKEKGREAISHPINSHRSHCLGKLLHRREKMAFRVVLNDPTSQLYSSSLLFRFSTLFRHLKLKLSFRASRDAKTRRKNVKKCRRAVEKLRNNELRQLSTSSTRPRDA